MRKNIREAARVIRSKNAGPFELTFDIILSNEKWYDYFISHDILNREKICEIFKIKSERILSIVHFKSANAIKFTIKRERVSGAPGETDIYGAQQHAPLLALEFEYTE
ncbi:MAG: DUF4387 domain-containing protein [Myxococcota bacterium]